MGAAPLVLPRAEGTVRSAEREHALLQAAQTDRAAFAPLYEAYVDHLYSYVLHCCHDPLLAEDIVAETFQRALEHVDAFEWRGRPLSAWLYRIASNALAAHYRRRPTLSAEAATALLPDGGPGPEQAVLRTERCREVRAAVAALPLLQRQVLVLRYGHGLRLKEIAQCLERSEGAIKQHLQRAHRRLHGQLGADQPPSPAARAGPA